jgi:hypothetical protein
MNMVFAEAIELNKLTKRIDSRHFERVSLIFNVLTRSGYYKSLLRLFKIKI